MIHLDLNILVGGDWNMTGLFSHSVGNVIIPIDFHMFQRAWNHQPDDFSSGLHDFRVV